MTVMIPRPAASELVAGLFAAQAPDLQAHLMAYGPLPVLSPAAVLDELERSGLTGRGGAGFPASIKVRAVAAGSRGRAIVVGNGAEGEPASDKDRQLLVRAPHLVLDGLRLAALATGAARACLYVRPDAVSSVRQALAARPDLDGLAVHVSEAPATFVAGQESAVVSRLSGGSALPRFSRQRVSIRGVDDRPTLVQNVETLAHLALIARRGGDWYASLGVPGSTGSFLATVHPVWSEGQPQAPAVWEVPHGTSLADLLGRAASVPVGQLDAVLVGGYHGSWLRLPQALPVPLSRDGLSALGASVGAGVIIPITSSSCGLQLTARIVKYLAAQSARQCGPCRFGLPQLAQQMADLAAGKAGPAELSALRGTAGLVAGRGACSHPDGTVRLIRSALTVFEPDIVLHGHGRCLARAGHTGGWL